MNIDPRVSKDVEDLRRRVWLIEQKLGMAGAPPAKPPVIELAAPPPKPAHNEVISRLMQNVEPYEAPPVPAAKSQAFSRLINEQPKPQPARPAPPVQPQPRPSIIAAARANIAIAEPPRQTFTPVETPKRREATSIAKPYSIPKPPSDFSMERLIGGRWYAWIGALAVIVGIGLFFKYAYDQHWLRFPPAWRCILGASFGLTLITVGEFIKRKINAAAAAGIFAAGIGSIYASTFAAYRLHLLAPHVALIFLAAAAVIGIVMGARARLVSVTIVSLIGGYLAPFLMGMPQSDPAVIPVFLLALMSVGLTLSARFGGAFSALRPLTWWATLIIGGFWTLSIGTSNLTLALTFLGLTWLGIHAELLFMSRRAPRDGETRPPAGHWLTWRPLLSSFSCSTWTVLLAVRVLDAAFIPDWIAPAALFGATSMAWLALAGNLSALRDPPRTDAERLGACLGVQSGALLIATIAMALGNWGEIIAWLALGVSSIVAGKWLRTRAFDIYGIIVLTLCTGRLLLIDSWLTSMTAGGAHVFGLVVSQWTALAAVAAASWIGCGLLIRPSQPDSQPRWRGFSELMVGLGITLLGGSLINSGNDAWTFSAIAAVVGILMAVAGRTLKSPGLSVASLIAQFAATLFIFPMQWWHATSSNAVTLLGFYIVPKALVAPFIGLTWLITPAITRPVFQSKYETSDMGLAAFVTLLFLPLLHMNVQFNSLAAALLTAGLMLITLGRFRKSIGLSLYGITVLGAGTVTALASRWWAAAGWGQFLGLTFGPEVLVLLYAAGAWLMMSLAALKLNISEFRQTVSERAPVARICAGVSMALFFAASYHANMHLGVLCLAWLAISLACGLSRKLRPELYLDLFMLLGLVPPSIVWVIEYATDWQGATAPLVVHPGLGIAALLAGAWLLGSFWAARVPGREEHHQRMLRALGGAAFLALIFTSTSLEVARIAASLAHEPQVRGAAVSIWWGIFAVLLITVGFWKRVSPARHVGLGLLAIALGKAMIVDLQGVPQLWRIVSFIGLGLLMLGVAVAYSRVSALWHDKLASEDRTDALPG